MRREAVSGWRLAVSQIEIQRGLLSALCGQSPLTLALSPREREPFLSPLLGELAQSASEGTRSALDFLSPLPWGEAARSAGEGTRSAPANRQPLTANR